MKAEKARREEGRAAAVRRLSDRSRKVAGQQNTSQSRVTKEGKHMCEYRAAAAKRHVSVSRQACKDRKDAAKPGVISQTISLVSLIPTCPSVTHF